MRVFSASEKGNVTGSPENTRGSNSNTIAPIKLKILQRDSEHKITQYQNYIKNMRCMVFWS